MVVNDRDLLGSASLPNEADAELIVDSYAVLTFAVSLQLFEAVPGNRAQLTEFSGSREHVQFTQCGSLDRLKA